MSILSAISRILIITIPPFSQAGVCLNILLIYNTIGHFIACLGSCFSAILIMFNAGTQKFIFSEVNVLMIVTLLISNLLTMWTLFHILFILHLIPGAISNLMLHIIPCFVRDIISRTIPITTSQ